MQSLKWNLPINGRRNFSEGTTDDRASFQKTSPPILGSCGKPVSFSLAADSMSPVKPLDNILHGNSTRFFSALGNLPTMSKQMELYSDVPQVSEDLLCISSMLRVSVAYLAPTMHSIICSQHYCRAHGSHSFS